MTIEPDELDARARSLKAERARPMARWNAKVAADPTVTAEQIEARRRIARMIARDPRDGRVAS